MTRKLIESTFVTLDGVIGDPQVWGPPYWDDEHAAYAATLIDNVDTLLLGRVTYEVFSRVASPPVTHSPTGSTPCPSTWRPTVCDASWNASILDGDVAASVTGHVRRRTSAGRSSDDRAGVHALRAPPQPDPRQGRPHAGCRGGDHRARLPAPLRRRPGRS